MKPLRYTFNIAVLVWGMIPVCGLAQRSDILPSERRQPAVEQALDIVNRVELEVLAADINNPFYPNSLKAPPPPPPEEGDSEPLEPVYQGPVSNSDLLNTVAPQITPSGTMILGGYPLLLFGQKKVKVGDKLPILYEGQRYTLTISAIEGSNFTLKLGNAELTRPINPAN